MQTQHYDFMDVRDNGNDDTLVCDINEPCIEEQTIDAQRDLLNDSGQQEK